MSKPKAQHGGKRPGAGRPKGSGNALGYGDVRALRALRHRVPEGTPPELAEVAGISMDRMVDVMLERVPPSAAPSVLKAATTLREEICGPVAQRVNVGGPDGGPLTVRVLLEGDDDA